MATKSPVLILAVLGAAALLLFSGKREQRFTPPAGGPTARPQPITSTRPTVMFGEEPPGGGISFGSRDPLPIPPVPFIGPTLPIRPSVPTAPTASRPPVSLPIRGPISPGVPAFGPEPFGPIGRAAARTAPARTAVAEAVGLTPIIDIAITRQRRTATVGNIAFGPDPL